MKETYELGFFNDSDSAQDWALFLDSVSIATFSLAAHKGTLKYIKVELADGDKVRMTVQATGTAAADLTRSGSKLVLTSVTPNEWVLEQETKSQYLVTCKLA